MAGVRSGKTVGGTSYSFTTLSGLVTRQTWGDSAIDFVYDENNQPLAMRYNGTWYYYVLNLQGDVVKLIRSDGAIVASYSYDPWGKVLTSSGSLAEINPLRYRGYYYDAETGFYYLQSRYYDPEIGRFINADSYATTDAAGLLSTNMYAYCENDPVNRSDPTGEVAPVLVAMAGGAALGVMEQLMTDMLWAMVAGQPLDECFSSVGTYVAAAIGGAISAFPGGGAMRVGVEIVGLSYIQTCVDVIFESQITEDEDLNGRIIKQSAINGGSTKIGEQIISYSDKIGSGYKGNNKMVKNAICIAKDITRTAGKYMSNFANILFRILD